MRAFFKRVLFFILCVLLATIIATFFSTQFVIAELANVGGSISMGERLSMSAYDIVNMGPLYGLFIFIGLLIAFLVAGLITRFAKSKRTLIYSVAGGACFIVMLYLMKAVFFGVPIIGGARSIAGLFFQALSGTIAGYVFARLTAQRFQDK